MEPNRNDPGNNRKPNDPQPPKHGRLAPILLALAVVLLISGIYNMVSKSKYQETTYSDFVSARESGPRKKPPRMPGCRRPATPACPREIFSPWQTNWWQRV